MPGDKNIKIPKLMFPSPRGTNIKKEANIAKLKYKATMLLFKNAATRFIFLTAVYLTLSKPCPLVTASSKDHKCDYDYLDPEILKLEVKQMCRNIIATCGTIHDKLFPNRSVGVCMNACYYLTSIHT